MPTKTTLKSVVTNAKVWGKVTEIKATFLIVHDDANRTIDHDLILTKTSKGWIAEMQMTDFPAQETITESAWKLAEWMEKMAIAIKSSTYDSVNLNGLVDGVSDNENN